MSMVARTRRNHEDWKAVRVGCGILAVGACGFGVVRAQKKVHVDRPIIEARAEDVSTIEGIVTASYETISGGVGVPRQWGRDRTLFDPNSRSVAIHVDAKTGAIKTRVHDGTGICGPSRTLRW